MGHLKGFMEFVREQGVVGLAVGFILGGAVSKVVSSIVNDVVNPFIGLAMGSVGDLRAATVQVGTAKIAYGNLVATLIDFMVIAAVVYLGVKVLGMDRLDKKK